MKSIFYVTSFLVANFLFLFDISAQQTFVNGSVTDSATGEALIGVIITSSDGGGAVTDVFGHYEIKVTPNKTASLTYTYTGFRTHKQDVEVADKNVTVDVKLVNTSKQLGIVVVSSGRYEQKIGEVPVSMEVIKPELIQNKNTTNVNQVIDQTPGVNVTDDQANIRGGSGYTFGSGSRVLLVVDDMPMLSGDAQDVKWNYLPVENVSQIEVMKGASSALFGSSALNGVIHFRTAYPTSKPQTTITMFSGFYDKPARESLKWWPNGNPSFSGINFGHSRQIGNLDLVMGGHVFTDEGYRYLETEERIRFNVNTRYRFQKVPGLSAGLNVNMMRTVGGLFILWESDSLAYIPLDSNIQDYKNYRYNIDPFIVYHSPKGHKHSLRTRLFVTDNNNDTEQGSLARFWYGEYQYQFRFKNQMALTAGVVGTYTTVESDLYDDSANGLASDTASPRIGQNLSAYIQLDRKFFDKLFVTVGGRFESYKLDTAETIYAIEKANGDTLVKMPFRPVIRIGVSYQIAEATYIRTSYGQGYRFPCVAEKFVRTSAGGLEIYPNLNLQPEYGQSAEIGIKQGIAIKEWKGYVDAAIFWMEYKDMMQFTFDQYGTFTDPLFGLGFAAQNIGVARIRGVDVSVMGQGKIGPVDISLLAGYTYMDPVSLTYNDSLDTLKGTANYNVLKYRYRHLAKFDFQVDYKKFSFGMSMRYNSFMENIDKIFIDATIVVPGIARYREQFNRGDIQFDTRMMYRINENMRIALITNNLFNRECTSRPADVLAPRNFTVQMMVKF